MTVSLYDLSVSSYLQTLGALEGILRKGLAHFLKIGINPDSILQERLYDDMEPFAFQVWNTVHASLGAIRGLREGAFGPPPPAPEGMDFAGLQKIVAQARGEMLQLQR